jgi:histidinol-phosphate aminotransferase
MRFASTLEHIVPYEPGAPMELVMRRFGLTEVAKLASNEFPLPPFDEVKAAIVAALDDLNRYPDGNATDLRAALAEHHGRTPAEITVGNGSCELLMLLGEALLEPGDEVVFADPSFVMYGDICVRRQARARTLASIEFRHDLQAMAAAVGPRTKMVIVCNPNNPTGTYEPAAGIARLVEQVPDDVLVVVDEAYNEFVTVPDSQDTLAIQRAHENVCCAWATVCARRSSRRPWTRSASRSTSTDWRRWLPWKRCAIRTRWRSAVR